MLAFTYTIGTALTWTATSDLPSKRMEGAMSSLGDGRVAYIGGGVMGAGAPLASVVLYFNICLFVFG